MTSVSPAVGFLLLLALAVGGVMMLGALGRIPMSMEPPRHPWWSGRRRRETRSRCEGEDETVAAAAAPTSGEGTGPGGGQEDRAAGEESAGPKNPDV